MRNDAVASTLEQDSMATALEKDESLAKRFFRNINVLSYGGATLPGDLYDRMEALAVKHTGHRIPFVTGWGSTETAPAATSQRRNGTATRK